MNYGAITKTLDQTLGIGKSFDLQRRTLDLPYGEVSFITAAGLCNTELCQRIIDHILHTSSPDECLKNLPCHDVTYSTDPVVLADAVLSGRAVVVAQGEDKCAVLDVKGFPLRSVSEPENDRVLRGPRDGFGEALIRNTALIRRRIKDVDLVMERVTVGKSAPTDVAICYVNGIADTSLVDSIRSRLTGLDLDAVNMTQESIAESLSVGRTFNPFPRVRYTERPDAAAAMLEEGSVILLCDNSPQAMILPTSVFDFLQESDDFYLPSVIGSYLRLTRLLIFGMSLFLTPLWYCCVKNAAALPTWLRFLDIGEPAAVPLILQLVIAEVMIDGLKLASLNTPNMLSSSLSVVGGLILGDFAVEAGWFSPQTILYMAIVSIAAFTQQSYELGYAFKFSRMLLLVLTELFGVVGLVLGLVFVLAVMASTRTVSGARSYLYPLIPFNGRALVRLLFRVRTGRREKCRR